MDNREYITTLYEIYKELLNEKERNYFEYYYFEDYSMQEIAELYKVSKAYASKYLNKINDKIINYEKILKINDITKIIATTVIALEFFSMFNSLYKTSYLVFIS